MKNTTARVPTNNVTFLLKTSS